MRCMKKASLLVGLPRLRQLGLCLALGAMLSVAGTGVAYSRDDKRLRVPPEARKPEVAAPKLEKPSPPFIPRPSVPNSLPTRVPAAPVTVAPPPSTQPAAPDQATLKAQAAAARQSEKQRERKELREQLRAEQARLDRGSAADPSATVGSGGQKMSAQERAALREQLRGSRP
jgi:hypothetical protein